MPYSFAYEHANEAFVSQGSKQQCLAFARQDAKHVRHSKVKGKRTDVLLIDVAGCGYFKNHVRVTG